MDIKNNEFDLPWSKNWYTFDTLQYEHSFFYE